MKQTLKSLSLVAALVAVLAVSSAKALDLGYAREDGGRPGAFLDFAASARALAMGGAHVAIADDASASYQNPAGLSQLERKDVVSLYSILHEETRFGSFSFAQPTVDIGTFGVGVVLLDSGNLDKRDISGAQKGGFSASETAVLLSHGIRLGDRWSVGETLKGIRQDVDIYSASAFGIDLGTMYQADERLQFGFGLRNALAPTIKLRNVQERYPLDARFGVKFLALQHLILATDFDQTQGRSVKVHLGGEWAFNQQIALRLGINENEMSAGMGVTLGDLTLDYAFAYHDAAAGITDLGASHRVGFHMAFGRRVADQEVSLRWQKKGQTHLDALRAIMDAPEKFTETEIEKHVTGARQVVRRQGFLRAQDLYEAQGYVYFFEKEYERSVASLGEASNLEPTNVRMKTHLETARAQMTEDRTREIVEYELRRVKDLYAKADWKGTAKSCEKILSFRPDNIDATAYLEDARARINEPIQREMKIAKLKFERNEYLDAIKSFQKVKEMDPDNKEAAQYIAHSIASLEKQAVVQAAVADHGRPVVFQIERNVEKSRTLYSQGLVLYSQGKLKEAATIWEQAVKFDNSNTLARNAYSRSQVELNEKQ